MSIQIKSHAVVGFRFSDVCVKKITENGYYYTYLTENLSDEIAKKFEGGRIDDEEVNPELIALVFDLDYFEYTYGDDKDAIIGVELGQTSVGERNAGLNSWSNAETAMRKVVAHIEGVDEEMIKSLRIEIGVVTKMKEVSS